MLTGGFAATSADILFLSLALMLAIRMTRYRGEFPVLDKFLTVTGIILVVSSVSIAVSAKLAYKGKLAERELPEIGTVFESHERKPDIYIIVLDGYARSDVLENIYDYNNERFINFLESSGFYVAEQSHANYSQTALSLASFLNFEYLDTLIENTEANDRDKILLYELIQQSSLRQLLEQGGYRYSAPPSGYTFSTTNENNEYRAPSRSVTFNEFEVLLMQGIPQIPGLKSMQANFHRKMVLDSLDALQRVEKRDYPVLHFVHLWSPHPPFVFSQDGSPIEPEGPYFDVSDGSHVVRDKFIDSSEEYVHGYREQLIFLTERIMGSISNILTKSEVPPVIIMMSDHGPGAHLDWDDVDNTDLTERLANFIALYMPGVESHQYYETMTPVNVSRLLLNSYFGTALPPLPDRSYFSAWLTPYDFVELK